MSRSGAAWLVVGALCVGLLATSCAKGESEAEKIVNAVVGDPRDRPNYIEVLMSEVERFEKAWEAVENATDLSISEKVKAGQEFLTSILNAHAQAEGEPKERLRILRDYVQDFLYDNRELSEPQDLQLMINDLHYRASDAIRENDLAEAILVRVEVQQLVEDIGFQAFLPPWVDQFRKIRQMLRAIEGTQEDVERWEGYVELLTMLRDRIDNALQLLRLRDRTLKNWMDARDVAVAVTEQLRETLDEMTDAEEKEFASFVSAVQYRIESVVELLTLYVPAGQGVPTTLTRLQ